MALLKNALIVKFLGLFALQIQLYKSIQVFLHDLQGMAHLDQQEFLNSFLVEHHTFSVFYSIF